MLNEDAFNHTDLIKVNESNMLILASGGPIMHFIEYTTTDPGCVIKNKVRCGWYEYDEEGENKSYNEYCFRPETLRRLVKFEIGDF